MSKQISTLNQALQTAILQDGGEAVFRHYGFTPSRRPQRINPFREERTSSFYITAKFGKVIFKDFGDDSIKGDCRKFVELYEHVDYAQAFRILCQIYGLADFQIEARPAPVKKKSPKKTKPSEPHFSKKLLHIEFKDFSEEELEFWKQKGQIDLNTLQSNRVFSVRAFQVQTEENRSREFVNLSFVFAYEIVPGQAYKLYMPKPAYRVYAPAKTVFLPSLEPAREAFGQAYSYCFGLDTICAQKPLILCAGEPDCLALKSAGYNAFTLGDERGKIPDFVMEQLKARGFKGKEGNHPFLSVVYDTDYTGLKAAQQLADTYGCQRLLLPKLFQQKSKEAPKPQQNDICDYLNLYGWDTELKLLLSQQIYAIQDYRLKQIPHFQVKKYLSEKSELLAEFIRQHPRVQADADAGIGKTHTMLVEMPKRLKKTILFAVPFALQVEQIEKEYQDQTEDLVCFHNASLRQIDAEEEAFYGQPVGQVNVCTYDRIQQVYERLEKEPAREILVVVDESHLLTSEYAYRTRAIHDVLSVCQRAERVVYLSATPDYSLCQFSGFRLIRFQRKINPEIQLTAFDYQGEPKKALLRLLLDHISQQKNTSDTTIIRLNNKTLAKVAANLLIQKKLYQPEEIDFVFSEKRKGFSTPAKESIVQESLIPTQVKLLFVTSCFDCGINIQNSQIGRIISFETRYTDNCKDTFKQLIARFRSLKKVQVWVCKPARYQELPHLKSKFDLYQRLVRDAQNKLDLLAYNDPHYCQKIDQQVQDIDRFGLYTPRTPKYIKANRDISATYKLLLKNQQTDQYQINYNYVRFSLKEYERKNLNSHRFYTDLHRELPNLVLVNREKLLADKKDQNHRVLKEMIQTAKDQKQSRIEQICTLIQQKPEAFFDAVHAEYRDVALREKIKQNFSVNPSRLAPKLEDLMKELEPEKTEELKDKEASVAIQQYDEEIITLSHRYFYLKELLIPPGKIPDLLQTHASEVNYGYLTKTLVNHINLFAKQQAGKQASNLIRDFRKLEDIQWLELLLDQVPDFSPSQYQQKKSTKLKAQWQSLTYDLKMLEYEQGNLLARWLDLLLKIQTGQKLKSQLRSIRRKLRTMNRKIQKTQSRIQKAKQKHEHSQIRGFEVEALSKQMNQLRTHRADWQGARANLRLLSSLYELKTSKRAVLQADQSGKTQYQEKVLVQIAQRKYLPDVLAEFGFSEKEIKNYMEHLGYQIRLDLAENSRFLSENAKKSSQAANHVHVTRSDWSEKYSSS